MKNALMLLASLLLLSSCAKEEFAANKGSQTGSVNPLESTSAKLCSQSTLISPQVDILMLWDNSTSFNVVTPETRASMGQLISSVSENFDYHILSVPLVSSNSSTLYQAQLVAKNTTGLTSDAQTIMRSKDVAASSLGFTSSSSSSEPGVDRAINIISNNRSNGIFRNGAYTMVVVISNEDDDSCESEKGVLTCANGDWQPRMQAKINQLLCLRGNSSTGSGCGSTLNSTMMRFINISPLSSCSTGNYKINYRYRMVSNALYSEPYSNGWPTSNDHLSPDVPGAYDSYNLCSISFTHIFDGVNTAIKQTLLKHKYNYWPVAGSTASFDPDTIRVVRSDGKILANRTGESNPSDGYAYVGNQNRNTRYSPTAGEPFNGYMIQLFGSEGNDKIVYPDCLTVSFDGVKTTYGYAYLQYGEPVVSTIQVYKSVNGGGFTAIPQSATNGWEYIGLQYTSTLDSKAVNMPAGSSSGYFIRLNGSYKFQNSTSTTTSIRVDYTSKN